MALTDWSPEEIAEMQAKGIDPRYATPTANQQPPPGVLSTVGETAKAHAGGYLGGGAGAIGGGVGAGALYGALAGSEIPLWGNIAGGIIGALAGGYGGQKVQQAIESPETYEAQQEAAARAAQVNPKTALGTDIAASALASGGMFNPFTATKGIRGIIGGLRGKGLTDEAKAVLLQSTINPAISTGMSLASGQGVPPLGELAGQAAGGSLFAKSWLPKSWLPNGRLVSEPKEEINNESETPRYSQPATTPFTDVNDDGTFKIGNKNIKNLYMKKFATPIPENADDIQKSIIRTTNDKLLSTPVDDMRQQLHEAAVGETLKEDNSMEYGEGGEMPEMKPIYPGIQEPKPEVTAQEPTRPLSLTEDNKPIFTPEILQPLIDKGVTTPKAVQKLYPKLNLSNAEAIEALRQADLLAELHLNRPPESEVQNATGIRENEGQSDSIRQVGEGSQVRSSSNMVETPSGSKESVSPQVGSLLPAKQEPNPLVLNPLMGESKGPVNAPPPVEEPDYMINAAEMVRDSKNKLGIEPNYNGVFNGSQLLATIFNKLSPSEQQIYKDAGIMKAFGNRKITREDAVKWFEEHTPKVEVRKFGAVQEHPEIANTRQKLSQLQHELETAGLDFNNTLGTSYNYKAGLTPPPEILAKVKEYQELHKQGLEQARFQLNNPDKSHWQSIAPKPEKDMPGYVEIAVVKPQRMVTTEEASKSNWRDLPGGTQFPSSHNFPPNTLGFVRGYMETNAKGEKVFHVIEVQSDWAQRVREEKENMAKMGNSNPESVAGKDVARMSDPLLPHYERLALKAAIDHARSEGATKIAISDAETAMMTEGHDRLDYRIIQPTPENITLAKRLLTSKNYDGHIMRQKDLERIANGGDFHTDYWTVNNWEDGGFSSIAPDGEPSQAAGMRLHYDRTLPKIAEELTGSKGETASFGNHKMAGEGMGRFPEEGFNPRKDLIFRNPDDTPKTDVSARVFDISKIPAREPYLFGKRYFTLSDYNRYQELQKQIASATPETMATPEFQQIFKENEALKNKYGGKPPPAMSEGHVLMPVQLQSHIINNKATTGSIVNGLANTPGHPFQEFYKEIEKILTPKDAAVRWVHDPTLDKTTDHRSNYDPVTDRVSIGTGSAGDSRVVTEELLHSMTAKKIPNFEGQGAEYYNRLQAYLKNGNNPHVKDLINAYLETAKAKGLHDQLFKDTVNEDGSTTKGLAGNPDLAQKRLVATGQGTAYAMGHLDEYLVHAFRTPEFQRELNNIKDPLHDGRTIWQSIVNAVRNLLGLSPKAGSMLDRVLRTGTDIIAEPRPEEGGYPQNLREPLNKPPEFEEKVEPNVRPFLGPVGKFFTNAISAARKVAPDVADAYHRLFNAKTELYGRVYGNVKNVMERTGFTKNDGDRLLEAARMEELNKSPVPMSFFKNQAQKQVWNEYKKVYREQGEEAVKDKQPVYDPHMGGYRARRLSDTSHPLMLNQKIGSILRENTDTVAVNKLKQEFLTDQARRGITPDQAQKNLNDVIKGIQGQASRQGTGNLNWFNANRRAMGTPLPDSWTIQDFEHNLRAYASRNASDRAHFKYIESNPSVMAQLGETTGPWGNSIPKSDKPVVAGNKDIQILSKETHGEVGPQGFYTERAGSSAATAIFIASPALSAVHVPISNLAGVVSLTSNPLETSRTLWAGLKGMVSGIATARKNGIMVPAARPAANVWDASLTAAERWQAAASIVRRIASLNDIVTKGNIGYMQAAMEYLVPSKISRAIQGDITAQQWLRKLDTDYTAGKQYSPEEVQQLSSRAVGYLHGTNDPRTMPEWMMRDSEISGFFSIAHWSVAQTDRFMRDIWTPATKGDMTPLVMSLFGATIGGYVIKELREQISGKHSPIPSLSEIAASDRQFKGNAGPLAYNMIAALQYAGFGGMFSQLAKYPFDMAYKNSPQGAAFPLDEEVSDLATTAYNVASAIANDPNINYVDLAKLVGSHVLTSDFRLSREAYHQMINAGMITGTLAERKMLSDKLGQLRRFQQVEGLPFQAQGTMEENPYMYPEQQEFKRTQDLQGAIESLPTLVSSIMQQYHDNPDVMMTKLRALKETQYSTFPSLEQMPLSFMKYMGYLNRYEGPEAAQAELMDYMKHKMVNEVKGSVVP